MYTLTSITKLSIWCRTVQMTTESVYKISVPASLSLIHSPTKQISSTLQQQKATFSLPASQFPFRSITQKVMIQWPVSAKRYFFFHPTSNTPLCMALRDCNPKKLKAGRSQLSKCGTWKWGPPIWPQTQISCKMSQILPNKWLWK